MVFCKVGVNVIYYGVLFCCWVVYELVCSYTFANFFCGMYVFVLYVNVKVTQYPLGAYAPGSCDIATR